MVPKDHDRIGSHWTSDSRDGKLANEDHTHIATEEELNVYLSNWWIRSNFVGSDTMPMRHRADFKEALSTLRRVKNAEDQTCYQNLWQSSSSSWWQWQDSWWHPSSKRWNLGKQWMVYLLLEWVSKLIWCKSYSDQFGNSQRSLPSPTGVYRVYLLLQETGYGNSTTKTTTMTQALRTSMRPTTAWTTTRETCTSPEHALRAHNICHTLFILSHMHLMAQVWVSSLVIHIHVRFSLSSPLSSCTSTCPSLSSSFPSLSCTSSCTLSSTTWSSCKTCATPRTRGVTTPMTSTPSSQERYFEKILLKYGWEKASTWECLLVHREKGFSYLCMWMTSNSLERNKSWIRCGKYSIEKSIWEKHHS